MFVTPEQQPGRVLEIRNDVQEADPFALGPQARHYAIEIVEIDPVSVLAHARQIRLHVAERGDRAGLGRQLQQRDIARIEQHARHEIEALLRAGRDEQFLE